MNTSVIFNFDKPPVFQKPDDFIIYGSEFSKEKTTEHLLTGKVIDCYFYKYIDKKQEYNFNDILDHFMYLTMIVISHDGSYEIYHQTSNCFYNN